MHLLHPKAQAVHHQLQQPGLTDVEGIAAAAVVVVAVPLLGWQAVAAGVVQTAPAQRGAERVALGGVVEDHVEQHLDAGRMQAAHHAAELLGCVAGLGRQARRRTKKAQRVVAPVVAQAQGREAGLIEPVHHRQQAHGADAQAAQVVNGCRVAETGKGAAQRLGHAGVQAGKALDVQLVQHGLRQWRAQGLVIAPVEIGRAHPRLQRGAGVVARIGLQLMVTVVAQVFGAIVQLTHDLAGARVEQQLARVEALAPLGPPRAVGPKTVELARCAQRRQRRVGARRQVAVPDILAADRQAGAVGLDPAAGVEQAQLDQLGLGRHDRDVQALAVPVHAQRRGLAGFQLQLQRQRSQGIHSRNTLASGGRSTTIDCKRP